MALSTGVSAPTAADAVQTASTSTGPPDPASFPPFITEEPPAFDWDQSDYVKAVLQLKGELISNPDDTVSRDEKPMLDRLEGIVRARIVTPDNIERAAYSGIDHGDLLSLVYDRPADEALVYREETKALVGPAWGSSHPQGCDC